MTATLSRALLALAICCLGESRREWALAMRGEFEAAIEEREPLAFAAGCLIAAWREMPKHAEGRLVLANHVLALGLLVPVAVFQFACAIGSSTGRGGLHGLLTAAGTQGPFLASAQLGAMPALLVLWLLLGVGHLRLAWVLLERDWPRIIKAGALIAAVAVTLLIFMEVLLLDAASLMLQAAALTIELTFILIAARWHARLFPNAAQG